eukprot:5089078-Amphidinium_carterae.1
MDVPFAIKMLVASNCTKVAQEHMGSLLTVQQLAESPCQLSLSAAIKIPGACQRGLSQERAKDKHGKGEEQLKVGGFSNTFGNYRVKVTHPVVQPTGCVSSA